MIEYGADISYFREGYIVDCHLLEFEMPTSTLRYNTSMWNLTWANQVWLGAANVFKLEFAAQSLELEVHGWSAELTAMNPSMLALALKEKVRGKLANLYYVIFDSETLQIVRVDKEDSGLMSSLFITAGAGSG